MNEAFKAYWQTRLDEQPELDDADKTEAQMAFEAAWDIKLEPFLEGVEKIVKAYRYRPPHTPAVTINPF